MGPWDNEEVVCLIEHYRHQIEEFGDDHIDFQVGLKELIGSTNRNTVA